MTSGSSATANASAGLLRHALLLFMQEPRSQPQLQSSRHHECSGMCDFMQHKQVFVCRHSGHHHVCTDSDCDRLIDSHEARTCELTNLSYPPQYAISAQGDETSTVSTMSTKKHTCTSGCEFRQQLHHVFVCKSSGRYHMCTPLECGKRVQTAAGAWICELTNMNFSSKDGTATTFLPRSSAADHAAKKKQKQRPSSSKKKRKQIELTRPANPNTVVTIKYEELQAQARNIIRDAFRPNPDTLKLLDVHAISSLCLTLWQQISRTSVFQQVKGSYKFANHVYVVLFDMINGVYFKGKCIVPENEVVRRFVADERTLKKCNALFKPRQVTRATKVFHACLAELYS
jgi:hypothetical protein